MWREAHNKQRYRLHSSCPTAMRRRRCPATSNYSPAEWSHTGEVRVDVVPEEVYKKEDAIMVTLISFTDYRTRLLTNQTLA